MSGMTTEQAIKLLDLLEKALKDLDTKWDELSSRVGRLEQANQLIGKPLPTYYDPTVKPYPGYGSLYDVTCKLSTSN